jgi:hypothetical protein
MDLGAYYWLVSGPHSAPTLAKKELYGHVWFNLNSLSSEMIKIVIIPLIFPFL